MPSSASAAPTAVAKSALVERKPSATGGSTTVSPAVASAPVASTPGLRELVSTATRGPAGNG